MENSTGNQEIESSQNKNQDKNQRTKAARILGKSFMVLTVISFLSLGLIINFFQLILICTSKLSNSQKWKTLHKNLNGELMYILFCPCIFLAYFWSEVKLRIHLEDLKLIEESKGPMIALMIPNHSYEIDYILCFVLADQLGNLGSYKTLSKYELKFLPIIGWALWMSDIIFVRRDWKKDKVDFGRKLGELFHYDQFLLSIFAEGTRFTKDKYEHSKAFAESKGIVPLKYHLNPRTRGFNYTVRYYLKALNENRVKKSLNNFRLFNLQIIVPPNITAYSDFLNGTPLSGDIYCQEVKLSEELKQEVINSKDEDDCPGLNKLLMDIYRRKDEIVDEFKANGNKFVINSPEGGLFDYKLKKKPCIIWFLGFCLTYSTFGYLALAVYAKSITFWSIVITIVSGCMYMMKRVERESQVKSSSASLLGHNKERKSETHHHIEPITDNESHRNNTSNNNTHCSNIPSSRQVDLINGAPLRDSGADDNRDEDPTRKAQIMAHTSPY